MLYHKNWDNLLIFHQQLTEYETGGYFIACYIAWYFATIWTHFPLTNNNATNLAVVRHAHSHEHAHTSSTRTSSTRTSVQQQTVVRVCIYMPVNHDIKHLVYYSHPSWFIQNDTLWMMTTFHSKWTEIANEIHEQRSLTAHRQKSKQFITKVNIWARERHILISI